MNAKGDILSTTLIIGMIAITIMAFLGKAISIATSCLIVTIITTFTHALISFFQNKPQFFNIPYNIPNDKKPQANVIISNFINTTKRITVAVMASIATALYIELDLIVYIVFILSGTSFIHAIWICHRKIRNLLNQS